MFTFDLSAKVTLNGFEISEKLIFLKTVEALVIILTW